VLGYLCMYVSKKGMRAKLIIFLKSSLSLSISPKVKETPQIYDSRLNQTRRTISEDVSSINKVYFASSMSG
jgi:hypothetical protein